MRTEKIATCFECPVCGSTADCDEQVDFHDRVFRQCAGRFVVLVELFYVEGAGRTLIWKGQQTPAKEQRAKLWAAFSPNVQNPPWAPEHEAFPTDIYPPVTARYMGPDTFEPVRRDLEEGDRFRRELLAR